MRSKILKKKIFFKIFHFFAYFGYFRQNIVRISLKIAVIVIKV